MRDASADSKGGPITSLRAARRATIAMVFICIAAGSVEAGRAEGSLLGTATPVPTLKCPPKIVPKCKPGEKPYCGEFSGKCCRAVSCRKAK